MKKAIITGVSRGIGRALAEKFLQEGYHVLGSSRSGQVEWIHQNFECFALDLADAESRHFAGTLIAERGQYDVLINNAGMFDERDEAIAVDIDGLRATLEVNLVGTIDFTERVLPALASDGYVFNISSRRGSCANTEDAIYPAYSISKAGLNMYTRKLAARGKGAIIVGAVHPGSVRTDMNPDGTLTPEESATMIYRLVRSDLPTGQFWSAGEQYPW